MIADVKKFIDFIFNAFYNIIITYKTYGGVYFYITLAVIFFYPLFSRVIKSLKRNG